MYFTINAASGGYRVHAMGANNKIVFWTEVYTTKAAANQAINLMKLNAANAVVYDLS